MVSCRAEHPLAARRAVPWSALSDLPLLMLGARSGLELGPLWRAINASYGGSFVSENDGPRLLGGEFDQTFALRLVCKDSRLAAALARQDDDAPNGATA